MRWPHSKRPYTDWPPTGGTRDNLSSNPLKIYDDKKGDGDFVVHQSGPLKNTYDREALAEWLKVDDDKVPKDRTHPLTQTWRDTFEQRFVNIAAPYSEVRARQREEAFKTANKQRAGESVAEHFLRCLEYNEAQGATAKGGIGPPIKDQDFKTTVPWPAQKLQAG